MKNIGLDSKPKSYNSPTFNWSKYILLASGFLVLAYTGLAAFLGGD